MDVEQVEHEYKKEICKQASRNLKILCLLGMAFFPLFAMLDAKNHPGVVKELLFTRLVVFLFFTANYFYIRRTSSIKKPTLYFSLLVAFGGAGITIINIFIGMENSPKFAGIMLVILAASTLSLTDGLRTFFLNIILVMTYATGAFLFFGTKLINSGEFLFALVTMSTTALIGASAAHLIEKTRKELFFSYFENKSAKATLKKELKSKKNTLDELAEEISTNKKRLEKALLEAQSAKNEAEKAMKLRDDFISVASHELKTPLSVLKTQSDILNMGLDDKTLRLTKEDTKKILENFNTNVESINRLIDDMRDVTRVESGNLDLHSMKFNLNELVQKVLNNFSLSDGVDIKLIQHQVVVGKWDPFRLEQVVVNLVSNAIKYGGGNLPEVHIDIKDGFACIEVVDFGAGIAKEDQEKIFTKYGRVKKDDQVSGLGLGLYISQEIVRSHGGRISVVSERGKGSTFKVEIPL
ncbi:MAG: hypothetical protein KC478_06495 [Bacteriovoracaceae bacterium]|nr:hypothetical protein [Bacteriovoracaceae bacterium]